MALIYPQGYVETYLHFKSEIIQANLDEFSEKFVALMDQVTQTGIRDKYLIFVPDVNVVHLLNPGAMLTTIVEAATEGSPLRNFVSELIDEHIYVLSMQSSSVFNNYLNTFIQRVAGGQVEIKKIYGGMPEVNRTIAEDMGNGGAAARRAKKNREG